MIIGIGEWGFRQLPMEEHFRLAKKFGFRHMEFGIGGGLPGRLPERPGDGDIAGLMALTKKYGITVEHCCLENDFTLADPAAHQAMVKKTMAQIRAAGKAGAIRVRLFAGFTPVKMMTPAIWDRMLNAFELCDTICQDSGMRIAIETHGAITQNADGTTVHQSTVTTDRPSLDRLLRDLPATIGFNYDPGNLKAVNPDDRLCCVELLNPRIDYCHLKDWMRMANGWAACAIGDDDLDYVPIFKRMAYGGVYFVEYEPTGDLEEGIRRSLDYLHTAAPGYVFG